MSIVDKFTSKNSQEIWSASCEGEKCNNLELLDSLAIEIKAIENATKGVNLGGGLCPNSYHLEFALKKLRYVEEESVVFVNHILNACFLTQLTKKKL
ncbi:hypothetical protein [Chromobacterium violaceum]|uniref:hypothetical protein n=1 Tax=Chromobacterium violaceum TaxID=536 RepID=UPI000A51602C|nr:hypothetical protein [Chromobacterium violaceum]